MTRSALPILIVAALTLGGCAAVADDQAPPTETAPSENMMDQGAEDDGAEGTGLDGGEAAAAPGAYVEYRDGIIAETAGEKVLFFHAPWCSQCRALEESILSGEIPADTTIVKVDYDSETELRQRYGVTLQTTVVYVDNDGEKLSSAVLYEDTTLDALLAAAP